MKLPNQRLILAVCAVSIAEVAMAALPTATVDRDPKDARSAKVVVNSPAGDNTTYGCQFAWRISFSGDVETTDHCEVNVPPGSKDLAICTKRYDKRISQVQMVGTQCKAAAP
jgi:hypothetical protein